MFLFQSGETVLIGAVRGGHVEIVRALLNKYADVDVTGQVGALPPSMGSLWEMQLYPFILSFFIVLNFLPWIRIAQR